MFFGSTAIDSIKYDKRKIMSRAWKIFKQDTRNHFPLCLKMAWSEARFEPSAILSRLERLEKDVAQASTVPELDLLFDELINDAAGEDVVHHFERAWSRLQNALEEEAKKRPLTPEEVMAWNEKIYPVHKIINQIKRCEDRCWRSISFKKNSLLGRKSIGFLEGLEAGAAIAEMYENF